MGKPTSIDKPLVWVDIETTGLNPREDHIIEIGLTLTTGTLLGTIDSFKSLVEPPDYLIRDSFVQEMHERSGLWTDLDHARANDILEPPGTVEDNARSWLNSHLEPDYIPAMCGSSVGFDRAFLDYWMPRVSGRFSYRNIDVSTIKELAARWRPDVITSRPKPAEMHRVLSDIQDSIDELHHYRTSGFIGRHRPLTDP